MLCYCVEYIRILITHVILSSVTHSLICWYRSLLDDSLWSVTFHFSLFILICIPFMLFLRIFCIKTEFAKIIPGRRRLQGGLLGFTSRAWGALEMTPGLKRHQCEIEILGQNHGALPPNLSVEKTLLLEPCMDYSVDFDFAINCQIQMAQICHQIHHFYATSWRYEISWKLVGVKILKLQMISQTSCM